MLLTPIQLPRDVVREARVQLGERDQEGPILYGTWTLMPWGMHDSCYQVLLDSGQNLRVWLQGRTDTAADPETWRPPNPLRIVLHAVGTGGRL